MRKKITETLAYVSSKPCGTVPFKDRVPKMAWQIMQVKDTGQDNTFVGCLAGSPIHE